MLAIAGALGAQSGLAIVMSALDRHAEILCGGPGASRKDLDSVRWIASAALLRRAADIDALRCAAPGLRLLCVVRDGRDAVVHRAREMMQTRQYGDLPGAAVEDLENARAFHLRKAGRPCTMLGDESLRRLMGEWVRYIGAVERARDIMGNDCRVVRLEDLAGVGDELGRVLRWLDVGDRDAAGADARAYLEHALDVPHTGWEAEKPGAFSGSHDRACVGMWRAVMTEDNKSLVKSMAGELLIELGYEQGTAW